MEESSNFLNWAPRFIAIALIISYVTTMAVVSFLLPKWKRFRYVLLGCLLLLYTPQLAKLMWSLKQYTAPALILMTVGLCWERRHPIESSIRVACASLLGYLVYNLMVFQLP
jgi:hypothetical protein